MFGSDDDLIAVRIEEKFEMECRKCMLRKAPILPVGEFGFSFSQICRLPFDANELVNLSTLQFLLHCSNSRAGSHFSQEI